MKRFASIPALKRRARLLSRERGIPLHAALDAVASENGFRSWSLLMARIGQAGTARGFLSRLEPGDLAMVAARPGQGKTLMGLRLASEVALARRASAFFSLDYAPRDVGHRLRAIGIDVAGPGARFDVDCCGDICARHVVDRLSSMKDAALAVVDYLQILDHDRTRPDLATQVATLKRFARESGVIIVCLSQIDRSYDPAAKPFPDFADVRLPNPLDLSLFDKACFLNAGQARFEMRGQFT